MKTYTIHTLDDLRPFKDDGRYYVPGHLELANGVEIDKPIEARSYITSYTSIKCAGSVKAGGSVEAGVDVEAGGFVEAGGYVKAGEYVHSMIYDIHAKKIITKRLPYWREYYAAMPPLAGYRDLILDSAACWDDIRQAIINGGDAQRIYDWDGWHWIIRGQIGCYLGLIDSFAPPAPDGE